MVDIASHPPSCRKSGASHPWWQGAVIYQIYPRSFQDSNGDGVGDLAGITRRLDYVAELGVEAIWISPFFTSPMHDFGYDISDYCDVDPNFGTLDDFDRLITAAHERGLRVIIDQVYAHSSSEHAWFAESRANRNNDKADWYIWADAKADGTPPNNWQSVFGGPAWTWDARRRQYYLHTFLKEQPQLNVINAKVQDALLEVARFWLERGVDGFRFDALNHSIVDPLLRDNPPAPDDGSIRTRPFDYQLKTNSQSQPQVIDFIERIRSLCNYYGAIFTVAEVGGDKAETEQKVYTAGNNRLSSAYGFTFLYAPALTPSLVRETLGVWEEGEGWPCWAFENHDAPRAISRWCKNGEKPENIEAFARMKMALLTALRGNIIIYQGEELGLEQDDIAYDQLQDPEAIANWPLTLSRDGCRTPVPWTDELIGGGFTTGTPWLPIGAANLARNVGAQQEKEDSMLALTRRLLSFRKASEALRTGKLTQLYADEHILRFDRLVKGGQHLRCWFNLSPEPMAVAPSSVPPSIQELLSINGASLHGLPGFSVLIASISE